jgi:DNA invertase Pin-like site-specific DNA recombinase
VTGDPLSDGDAQTVARMTTMTVIHAAIYARKSTDQRHVDEEAKAVALQLENARQFATSRGWVVCDDHVYSDDAVSGAARRKLVNRHRLLDAATSTPPPFQVIVMRDASRFQPP